MSRVNDSGSSNEVKSSPVNLCILSVNLCKNLSKVLSTVVFKVLNDDGYEFIARALIDQLSQASFISESLYRRLKLNFLSLEVRILGI